MQNAGVAEWQTHQTQNLTGATSCRFKSGRRQEEKEHCKIIRMDD